MRPLAENVSEMLEVQNKDETYLAMYNKYKGFASFIRWFPNVEAEGYTQGTAGCYGSIIGASP